MATPRKKPEDKLKVGRKPIFKPEFCEIARKFCLLGATDEKLAEFFEVSVKTLNNWKGKYPEFVQALKDGKEIADAEVADSLFHRARGYSHPEVHVSNYQGDITLTPLTKHYPPDSTAGIFWLKNRQRQSFRDRHEHTGADGEAIMVDTPEGGNVLDAARRIAFALAEGSKAVAKKGKDK
jgi:hypothetical protein